MSRPPRVNAPTMQDTSLLAMPLLAPNLSRFDVEVTLAEPVTQRSPVQRAGRSRRKQKPIASIKTRIKRIDAILDLIGEDVATRRHLLKLCERSGYYCTHCTPLKRQGACGAACPLLAPRSHRGGQWDVRGLSQFKDEARAEYKLYADTVHEMNDRADVALARTVSKWERDVKKLHTSGMSFAEYMEMRGWDSGVRRKWGDRPGTKVEWDMARSWRQRRKSSLIVAPEGSISPMSTVQTDSFWC